MRLFERFIEFIERENLLQPHDELLLAVSGGVDSVVMCELCRRAGYSFAIAHCNFQLRGDESDRDKAFVTALATKYEVNFYVRDFNTAEYASVNKIGTQEAARKLRYQWFYELLETSRSETKDAVIATNNQSKRWLVTAHHADDNMETLLMNFFRGTGIQGLRGIQPKQEHVIRPLLLFRKQEIVDFATQEGLQWAEDSSNRTDTYSRNFFRNKILPLVQQIYPQTEQNLIKNIQRFREIEVLYRQAIDLHLHKLVEHKAGEVHIPLLKLKKVQPLVTIVHEIIQQYGFTAAQVPEVLKLADSESGKYIQSNTHRIIKNRNWLIITPAPSSSSEHVIIEKFESPVFFDSAELHFKTTTGPDLQVSNDIAQLNVTSLELPLLLRKWKTGDYFYPLGMKKKKKISRFLIDQKVSKSEKENTWILEMNKKIIWVVGMRIDERFKVIDFSKPVLSITLKRQQFAK